jgi:hypothetical protein
MNQGAILLAARKYEGQLEQPVGSNWGPADSVVVRSLAIVGLHAANSWCAGFACLCAWEANDNAWPKGFRPSASALHLWELNAAAQVAVSAGPEPEDFAIYDHGGGHGHVDIVEMVTIVQGSPYIAFNTIGGNTNKGGSRQGIGVFGGISRRTDDPLLKGFLRLSKLRPVVA